MMIEKAGYKPVHISKTTESTAFPFLTVIAKKIGKKTKHSSYKKEWFPHLKSYKNLKVIDVDEENKILIINGSVPGRKNSVVFVNDSVKKN